MGSGLAAFSCLAITFPFLAFSCLNWSLPCLDLGSSSFCSIPAVSLACTVWRRDALPETNESVGEGVLRGVRVSAQVVLYGVTREGLDGSVVLRGFAVILSRDMSVIPTQPKETHGLRIWALG